MLNKNTYEVIQMIKKYIPNFGNIETILANKDKSDLIDYLLVLTFDEYQKESIDKDTFLKLIRNIQNIDKNLYPTPEKLLERLKWLDDMELKYTETGLSQNHKEVMEIFDKFNIMLHRSNIEHYYTSGILPYLLSNTPLQRYHHDIDIFVNLNNLKQLEETSAEYGFNFIRKIGFRPDGIKRRIIKMYYNKYNIPLTIFMYCKTQDGYIVQKEFIYDEDNNLSVEDMYNTPKCVDLSFSDKINYHNNIPYKAITMEALYECKEGLRKKDIYDCAIMKKYVDSEKLKQLKYELTKCPKNKISKVQNNELRDFINGTNDRKIEKY